VCSPGVLHVAKQSGTILRSTAPYLSASKQFHACASQGLKELCCTWTTYTCHACTTKTAAAHDRTEDGANMMLQTLHKTPSHNGGIGGGTSPLGGPTPCLHCQHCRTVELLRLL
jgi:hypothetical protein